MSPRPLPPFRLERWFARFEFSVEHHLSASDCESMSVGDLLALEPGAAERFQAHWLGYTESAGAPALRNAIATMYTTVGGEDVLVHTGAQEAIYLFMHAALRAGDHVVVHSPCYQSLAEVARTLGCEVTPWRAREEDGWRVDLDELAQILRPATRVVVVNTPHNPTGHLMSAADYHALHAMLEARGITLFSDEVYRESEYSAADRLPAACDVSASAVSLGVLSKTYGLAGLRIGWVATRNTALLQRMAELKDYTTICNSAPSEFLGEIALRHRATLAERNVALITANLALLDNFMARHAARFAWVKPKAGAIAFPRLREGDADTFCDRLVREAGVLLLPGSVYDAGAAQHLRIGFGRRGFAAGLQRLEEYLASA